MASNPFTAGSCFDPDIALALSQALGVEPSGHAPLDDALYEGLQPVVAGMEAGDLTEEQASILIEALLVAYTDAAINVQIETLFQELSNSLLAGMSGGEHGRR